MCCLSRLATAVTMLAVALCQPAAADVVAFTSGDYTEWQTWNWTTITHLGFWTNPNDDVRAMAKQHGVKLFADSHLPDQKDWTDSDKRKAFAEAKVKQVQDDKLDGVFFDFEGQLNKAEQAAYTELAQKVSKELAAVNASIFVCVGGRPSYEFRNYDYSGLADASDFLFIMGYDMHFWDDYTCVTKGTCSPAEAPLDDLRAGVKEYLAKVKKDKLVLGLPWYGQRYTDVVIPFNVGQISYSDVLANIDAKKFKSKTFDRKSSTWKAECVSGGCLPSKSGKHGSEIWFDDAQSLVSKYSLAGSNKLRGVGVWEITDLPVGDKYASERDAMWAALARWNNY
jgi:spore germination protein YaaH